MAPHETSTNEATGDHSRVATSADPHGAEYQKYSRVSPSRNQNIGWSVLIDNWTCIFLKVLSKY